MKWLLLILILFSATATGHPGLNLSPYRLHQKKELTLSTNSFQKVVNIPIRYVSTSSRVLIKSDRPWLDLTLYEGESSPAKTLVTLYLIIEIDDSTLEPGTHRAMINIENGPEKRSIQLNFLKI